MNIASVFQTLASQKQRLRPKLEELSELIGVEENTVATGRRHGIGPPSDRRIHAHLTRYEGAQVLTWIRSRGVSKSQTPDRAGLEWVS